MRSKEHGSSERLSCKDRIGNGGKGRRSARRKRKKSSLRKKSWGGGAVYHGLRKGLRGDTDRANLNAGQYKRRRFREDEASITRGTYRLTKKLSRALIQNKRKEGGL